MRMFSKYWLLCLVPVLAFAGETLDEKMSRKFQPARIAKKVMEEVKIGVAIMDPQGVRIPAAKTTVYVYETGKNYESSRSDLEGKGVSLVELQREDLKNSGNEDSGNRNPWKIPGYRMSVGEDEEGWRVVLSTHQFDGVLGIWVEKTAVRVIVAITQPPNPVLQKPTQPVPSSAPPASPEPPATTSSGDTILNSKSMKSMYRVHMQNSQPNRTPSSCHGIAWIFLSS